MSSVIKMMSVIPRRIQRTLLIGIAEESVIGKNANRSYVQIVAMRKSQRGAARRDIIVAISRHVIRPGRPLLAILLLAQWSEIIDLPKCKRAIILLYARARTRSRLGRRYVHG